MRFCPGSPLRKSALSVGLFVAKTRRYTRIACVSGMALLLLSCLASSALSQDAALRNARSKTEAEDPAAKLPADLPSRLPATSETSIEWLHKLDKAHARAVKLGQPLLVDFEAEWCGWCKKLDRETYSEQNVIRFVNEHFVPLKLDVGKSPENKQVSVGFEVTSLPTILVVAVRPHEHCLHVGDHAGHDHGDARPCHESLANYVEVGRIEGFREAPVFLEQVGKIVKAGSSLNELGEEAQKHLDDAVAQRAYARALLAADRRDDAEQALRRALEHAKTGAAGLRFDLGDLLRQAGKYEEAVALFRQVVEDPTAGETRRGTYLPMARCLVSLDRPGDAEQTLDRLLGGVAARLEKALAERQAKSAEKKPVEDGAEPLLRDTSSLLETEEIEGLFLRAYLRARLGRSREAVADMKVAEQADPHGPWGMRAGFILQRLDR